MDILFGPDERRGLAGPYRCGKEQLSGTIAEACSPAGVSRATRTTGPWYSTPTIRPAQPAPFSACPIRQRSARIAARAMRCGQHVMTADEPGDEGARRMLENLARGPKPGGGAPHASRPSDRPAPSLR